MDDFRDEEEATNIISVSVQDIDTGRGTAYFIVLAGTNVGEMFKIEGTEVTLGRARDSTIRLFDEGISRSHCMVKMLPTGDLLLQDLNSSNGTFANGERIKSHLLEDGDKVQVGSTTILKFTYHDKFDESFQRQMYDAALRDGLTKAFNKKYFLERLHSEFSYAMRHGTFLTLLMMDLDHFKKLNDGFGHLAGDYVLLTLTTQITQSVRTEDVFARYGGEEFSLISRGIRVKEGAIVAERLRRLVDQSTYKYDDNVLPVTISIGVAGVPCPGIQEPADLVAAADRALYAAKGAGRNKVVVHEEEK